MTARFFVGFTAAYAWVAVAAAAEPRPEDIAFVARCDGSTQRYVVVPPDGFLASVERPLLVALHGHGSDRWQFVRDPRDECRAARDVAARHGMIFVSPDYRARTSWMGPKAESDMLQILDELKRRHRIGKTIVVGGSMGGAAALALAAMHPDRVDGVVAMNGTANLLEYENFQDAIRESFGGTKRERPEQYKRRSAEYWPERLRMPMAVTTGGADRLVPPESVLRLAAVVKQLQGNVLVIHRPQGGHETNYADGLAALEFVVQRVLGKAAPAPK
jgi:pimeloyl-ACP methyl ester carboxylesterase